MHSAEMHSASLLTAIWSQHHQQQSTGGHCTADCAEALTCPQSRRAPHRYKGGQAVREEVLIGAKAGIRALPCDALPVPPARVQEHAHRHHDQVPHAGSGVADQDEGSLQHRRHG